MDKDNQKEPKIHHHHKDPKKSSETQFSVRVCI